MQSYFSRHQSIKRSHSLRKMRRKSRLSQQINSADQQCLDVNQLLVPNSTVSLPGNPSEPNHPKTSVLSTGTNSGKSGESSLSTTFPVDQCCFAEIKKGLNLNLKVDNDTKVESSALSCEEFSPKCPRERMSPERGGLNDTPITSNLEPKSTSSQIDHGREILTKAADEPPRRISTCTHLVNDSLFSIRTNKTSVKTSVVFRDQINSIANNYNLLYSKQNSNKTSITAAKKSSEDPVPPEGERDLSRDPVVSSPELAQTEVQSPSSGSIDRESFSHKSCNSEFLNLDSAMEPNSGEGICGDSHHSYKFSTPQFTSSKHNVLTMPTRGTCMSVWYRKLCRWARDFAMTVIHPTDNKFALKVFGSRKALHKERVRCLENPWIIHPYSVFRFTWDFIMLLLLIINLVILPVGIAFFEENYTLAGTWMFFNCVNDSIFVMDILFNFRTGIAPNQTAVQVILDPSQIKRMYLKSWFAVDFVSSIPLDYICLVFTNGERATGTNILNASRTLKMLRLTKLLSLMRLLRVSRLMRYASQWEELFNVASAAFKIVNLISMMVLISHWNGCLMFLIPRLYEFPATCWVSRDGLTTKDWQEQYSWALFRAMSHMLSIGYGQEPPQCLMDLWFVIISMLSGATCYALFIGHATNMIQQFDSSRRLFAEKMQQIEEYMAHRKLNPELQVKVHNYYEYKYKGKMFDEDIILDEMNECLREEILNYNCRDLVKVVPFFEDADPQFVSCIVARLQFEVYQPGDYVITEGSIGTKMFFILQGTVEVITSHSSTPVAQLTDGAYFGEICLLAKVKRTASVRAESYCDLYSLQAVDFLGVLAEFPLMRARMEQLARIRLSELGRSSTLIRNTFPKHSDETLDDAERIRKTPVVMLDQDKYPVPSATESADIDDDDVTIEFQSTRRKPSRGIGGGGRFLRRMDSTMSSCGGNSYPLNSSRTSLVTPRCSSVRLTLPKISSSDHSIVDH
ncbi:potassium/sodium hyperpolarization-activated cyclic nucleotide-gated channel 3-like isoform X2 [Convolutriloba macropyga]|uniref:potassium/sodium hyperpolarization-activated cyclic nucleotide-gated channel 3-like isoform X2 n=1 Tax=Convolutriloba macropyga TaxID=536237 RepID=UPI003F51AD01